MDCNLHYALNFYVSTLFYGKINGELYSKILNVRDASYVISHEPLT